MSENKPVPETDGPTQLESSIIRQVEYYFGDLNIPRDKYLLELLELDEGWVPLNILTTFNRLRNLTMDVDKVAKALRKSTSGLVTVSDDNKKIRRNPAFPIPEMTQERRMELIDRSIYAKGFPKEITLDELLMFFKGFEEVENVIMRKYQNKYSKKRFFKGSVFATFKTKEQAEKFIALKGIRYKKSDLLILWQNDYQKEKRGEGDTKKIEKEKTKAMQTDFEDSGLTGKDINLPTGSVLSFTVGSDKMTRKDIREALTALGAEVAYVDFNNGETTGLVRLAKKDSAKELIAKTADGKFKIAESEVVIKPLEEEEEAYYLNQTVENILKHRRESRAMNKGKSLIGKGKSSKGQGKKRKQEETDQDEQSSSTKPKLQ